MPQSYEQRVEFIRCLIAVFEHRRKKSLRLWKGFSTKLNKKDFQVLASFLRHGLGCFEDEDKTLGSQELTILKVRKSRVMAMYRMYKAMKDVAGVKFEAPNFVYPEYHNSGDMEAQLAKYNARKECFGIITRRSSNLELELLYKYEQQLQQGASFGTKTTMASEDQQQTKETNTHEDKQPESVDFERGAYHEAARRDDTSQPPRKRPHPEPDQYTALDDIMSIKLRELVAAMKNSVDETVLLDLMGSHSPFTGPQLLRRLHHFIDTPVLLHDHALAMWEEYAGSDRAETGNVVEVSDSDDEGRACGMDRKERCTSALGSGPDQKSMERDMPRLRHHNTHNSSLTGRVL